MRDLESQIASWRREMKVSGIGSREVLDELEGHLRDDIERRMQSGVEAQRAFELAAESMGQPRMLRSEFQKIQLHRIMSPAAHRRAQHVLAIIALTAFYIGILLPIAHKFGMWPPGMDTTDATMATGDVAMLVIGAAICIAGYACSRKFLLKA